MSNLPQSSIPLQKLTVVKVHNTLQETGDMYAMYILDEVCMGNVTGAAKILGISRSKMYRIVSRVKYKYDLI